MRNNFKELNKRLDEREEEIERLNNIINELEKEIYNVVDKMYNSLIEIEGRGYYYQDLLPLECLIFKLKELKEK